MITWFGQTGLMNCRLAGLVAQPPHELAADTEFGFGACRTLGESHDSLQG